jgi:hypothetical protein
MNFIQYIKQAWKAGTSGGTPLSPDRLNHMEDGIKNNNDMISELNNNIFNKHITNIPIRKKLRVHSTKAAGNSIFWGIAFVQGAAGAAAACAIVQGYGSGSSARYHITPILNSSYIIWEYGKDGDMDFFVTNNCPTVVNFAFYEFNKNGFEFTLLDT